MITGSIKNQIDQIWNAFWSGGISNPLRGRSSKLRICCSRGALDDLHTWRRTTAARLKKPIERRVFPKARTRSARTEGVRTKICAGRISRTSRLRTCSTWSASMPFPFLRDGLTKTSGGEDSTYAHHMKDARFTIPTAGAAVESRGSARCHANGGPRYQGRRV